MNSASTCVRTGRCPANGTIFKADGPVEHADCAPIDIIELLAYIW